MLIGLFAVPKMANAHKEKQTAATLCSVLRHATQAVMVSKATARSKLSLASAVGARLRYSKVAKTRMLSSRCRWTRFMVLNLPADTRDPGHGFW